MEAKQDTPAEKAKSPKGNAYDWLESLVTAIIACIIHYFRLIATKVILIPCFKTTLVI